MALIVSDIHGEYKILKNLFSVIEDTETLVFLGDIVDRGENSKLALRLVNERKLRFPDKTFLLRGNHELMLWDALYSGIPIFHNGLFLNNGGTKTLEDYGYIYGDIYSNRALEELKKDFDCYWKNSLDYLIIDDVYISHAARHNPDNLLDDCVFWERNQLHPLQDGLRYSVHGHTIVEKPTKLGNSLYIDLGSFKTGRVGVHDTNKELTWCFNHGSFYTI